MVEAAKETTAKTAAHNEEKQRLLDGARKASDPIVKKAFQIHLQTHRRRQRVQKENQKFWREQRETTGRSAKEQKSQLAPKFPKA